jgi:hypothetical protein
VKKKARAILRHRPIQPANACQCMMKDRSSVVLLFHSQNLRRQIKDFGVFGAMVGPGTRNRQTTNITPSGTRRLRMIRSQVGMIEGVRGYEMLRSTTENGRIYGIGKLKAPPTRAMALHGSLALLRADCCRSTYG